MNDNLEQELAKTISVNEVNHNNVMFNLRLTAKSNIIDFKTRQETLKKDDLDKVMLKQYKKDYKSKAFNKIATAKKDREELIQTILGTKEPKFNAKLIIK